MTTVVTIAGMRSEHCKRAVFTALAGVAGLVSADVQMGSATIEHDGTVTREALHDAITAAVAIAGYTVLHCVDSMGRRPLPLVDP